MNVSMVSQSFGSMWVEIRKDGTVWFSAKDVCDKLGYANDSDAISKHVSEKHKGVAKRDSLGGIQQIRTIDETGLYRLVLRSRMPKAEEFMDWVTEDILPSIRKTGKYETATDNPAKMLHAEQKQNAAATKALCREMQKHLTGTDIVSIAKKLNIKQSVAANVLHRGDYDVTVMRELFDRARLNAQHGKQFYTPQGCEEAIVVIKN